MRRGPSGAPFNIGVETFRHMMIGFPFDVEFKYNGDIRFKRAARKADGIPIPIVGSDRTPLSSVNRHPVVCFLPSLSRVTY